MRFVIVPGLLACACASFVLAGCGSQPSSNLDSRGASTSSASSPGAVQLVDVTQKAGIGFKHNNGSFGLRWTPEVMGSGVAFIDADGDGYQDIFLVNGRDWTDEEIAAYRKGNGSKHLRDHGFKVPARGPRRRTWGALYRNNRDGTFSDISEQAGLGVEIFGMSACVGDYDNDGRSDLYVTGYGRNALFRNESAGGAIRFREVAKATGVIDGGWSISATWLDYNRDGRLDLFVSHYLDWAPAKDAWLESEGAKNYTAPEHYQPVLSTLYRNDGGRFSDVSKQAGIRQAKAEAGRGAKSAGPKLLSKAMSVATCDYNNDEWPDIIVSNDLMANQMFENNKDGTFSEIADRAGIAYSMMGVARSGMGVDVGDIDHSNRESVAIANFSTEMLGLYQNQGGSFADIASPAGIAESTSPLVGFGCHFSDIDNDGWLDLVVANGHVYDVIAQAGRGETHAQKMLLFRNASGQATQDEAAGKGAPTSSRGTTQSKRVLFEDVSAQSGEAFSKPIVGRGVASADIDLDGDSDIIVSCNNGAPLLLRNDGGSKNNALRVILRGTKSNRDGIGAGVWAQVGPELLRRRVKSGASYLSQSELPVTFGLGQSKKAELVAVRWPSGKLMQFPNIQANQIITIDEDKGIVHKQSIKR